LPAAPARLGSFLKTLRVRENPVMAYDEKLAGRVRDLMAGEPGLTEQRMFGGLAFLIGGNMAVAASGQGGLLVRVDPAQSEALIAASPARPLEMRGRQMPGWLRVDTKHLRSTRQLATWVERGTSFARSLPAKR
jgi:TfoX/Sxy family transcriptional regulator of competence genes